MSILLPIFKDNANCLKLFQNLSSNQFTAEARLVLKFNRNWSLFPNISHLREQSRIGTDARESSQVQQWKIERILFPPPLPPKVGRASTLKRQTLQNIIIVR